MIGKLPFEMEVHLRAGFREILPVCVEKSRKTRPQTYYKLHSSLVKVGVKDKMVDFSRSNSFSKICVKNNMRRVSQISHPR